MNSNKNNMFFSLQDDDLGQKTSDQNEIDDYIQRFFEDECNVDDDQIYLAHQYEASYSVKELLKICEYYGIIKQRNQRKKMELIYAILLYEKDPTNESTVETRKRFWGYLDELKQDKFMKQFVVW
jgi:hypothetical protein